MTTATQTLENGRILKGDKVLALGFDQIWIDGDLPVDASEVDGLDELAEIDMQYIDTWHYDSGDVCERVQMWVSVTGDQRITMTTRKDF